MRATEDTLAMVKGFKILAEAVLDGSGLGTPEGVRAYRSSLREAVARAEMIMATLVSPVPVSTENMQEAREIWAGASIQSNGRALLSIEDIAQIIADAQAPREEKGK